MNNIKNTITKTSKIIPTTETIQNWINYANKNNCSVDLVYYCFDKYVIHIRPGDNAETLEKKMPKVYGGNRKNKTDIWSR